MSRPLLRTFVRPAVRCLLATSHPAPPPPATVRLLSTSLSSCSLIPQRSYSTAAESVASPSSSSASPIPPSTWATSESIRVVPPSPEAIRELEEEGIDVPLIPENQATLNVTPSAWKQLAQIAKREKDPDLRFRVAVESGGCHGYQYKMDLTSEPEGDDYTFHPPPSLDPAPTPIIIDATSLGLLKGSTLDFARELIGSSFRIAENPQAKGSGCGCGVSWEAKED